MIWIVREDGAVARYKSGVGCKDLKTELIDCYRSRSLTEETLKGSVVTSHGPMDAPLIEGPANLSEWLMDCWKAGVIE